MTDVDALLALADRLEQSGQGRRIEAAAAARRAAERLATAGADSQVEHVASLRRRALELAVRLDLLGHPGEADVIYGEVARRAEADPSAMPDRPFRLWLAAVEASFPDPASSSDSEPERQEV